MVPEATHSTWLILKWKKVMSKSRERTKEK